MHMSDALLSPAVGITMWAVTAGVTAYSLKKVAPETDTRKIPLMGIMGAFIFAAQMINFSIPGTGSSGHLGGGLLLSAVLGPYAGFLTMLSILIVQALFFADGGLLALGANVFNLGFVTSFIAYPLLFKPLLSKSMDDKKILTASLLTAIVGLQIGAFSVVLETMLSGKTVIPFGAFLLFMQPIHLAIGIVEGLVTAAVLVFVIKQQPEILDAAMNRNSLEKAPVRKVILTMAGLALIVGLAVSWFASSHPDGLEWSLFKSTGVEELESDGKLHESLGTFQEKVAILPDYGFKSTEGMKNSEGATSSSWPEVNAGTSVSGLVGGLFTFLLAAIFGFGVWLFRKSRRKHSS